MKKQGPLAFIPELDRRQLLNTAGLALAASGLASTPLSSLAASSSGLQPPEHNPDSEYVFSITATIDDAMTVGDTATGQVRAIPITGGEIEGEGINGRVIPGGADWQLTRQDGVTELVATYAIELGGDTLVKVVNKGIVAPPLEEGGETYFRTHATFTAPAGEYAWLNDAIFLCKASLHPERDNAVLVKVFRLI